MSERPFPRAQPRLKEVPVRYVDTIRASDLQEPGTTFFTDKTAQYYSQRWRGHDDLQNANLRVRRPYHSLRVDSLPPDKRKRVFDRAVVLIHPAATLPSDALHDLIQISEELKPEQAEALQVARDLLLARGL